MGVDEVLVGRVGHDLRGELATMIAGVHYLLRYEGELSETARQMLDRVNGAGQRLRRLLDEFELSVWIDRRDPAGLAIERVQLGPLIEGVLTRLEQRLAARDVSVDVHIAEDLPEIEGDPDLLGSAIELVIDFAASRSPRGALSIVATRSGGRPVLEISDRGGPVDDAVLAGLLAPFGEAAALPPPEPGARRRERLGLGLAIARGVFETHGGSLEALVVPEQPGILLRCVPARPPSERDGEA